MAPLGVTVWVLFALIQFADGLIEILPEWAQPSTYLGFPIPGLGVLLAGCILGAVGFATRYYAGRRIVEFYESLLGRVPLMSGIYQGVKQLFDTVFSQKGRQFRQVVVIEYPRQGLYCLAFLTNEREFLALGGAAEGPLVGVFLPTTPNPTSGFYLMVPTRDVLAVDLTVEEAFKLIMSAGIITPAAMRGARRLDDLGPVGIAESG